MPTTSSTTSARPASARSPAGAARTAATVGTRRAQSATSSSATSSNGCFWHHDAPARRSATTSMANRAYLDFAVQHGLPRRRPSRSSSSSIPSRCSASAWRRAATARSQPPESERAAHREPISTRCRSGTRRSKRQRSDDGQLSAARAHPAADAHVPFLGLAERLAAADHQPATGCSCTAATAATLGHRRRRLGLDRKPPTAASRARSAWSTASTRTRCGPGTPSASARAPGTSTDDAAEVEPRLPAQSR